MNRMDISYYLSCLLIYISRSRCCRYAKQSAGQLSEVICMNYETSELGLKTVSPVNSQNIQTKFFCLHTDQTQTAAQVYRPIKYSTINQEAIQKA